MKADMDTYLAVLGAQTASGLLFNNWVAGAGAALGIFVGLTLAKAPRAVRQYIMPALLAVSWAIIGPHVFR